MAWSTLVGITFLVGQLAWGLYERTRPTRYFCWAPNDTVTDYELEVTIDSRLASDDQVYRRYGWPRAGRFENVPQHLVDIIRQYEITYGRRENARVRLRYRVNNHAPQEWVWPPVEQDPW